MRMMGFFSRSQNKSKPGNSAFVYDQAVIIEIDLSDQPLKPDEVFKSIKALEDEVVVKLPRKSGLDGEDLGSDEAIIYLYGPNADTIFAAIESTLRKSKFGHMDITLQYGLPDDPATQDKKFTL